MFKLIANLFRGSSSQSETPVSAQSLNVGSDLPPQAPAVLTPRAAPALPHSVESAAPTDAVSESAPPVAVLQEVPMPVPGPQRSAPAVRAPSSAYEEGEALRATDAWRQGVEEGTRQWDAKMLHLMERIQALQQDGGGDSVVLLLMVASYYHLDFSPQTVVEPKFAQALHQRIVRDLAVPKYKAHMEDKTRTRWNSYPRSVDYYIEEFVTLRPCFLDGFIHMVDTLPQMMDVVDGLCDQITAAEQEFMPARQGDHLLRFRGFLSRLAQAQLPGVRPLDFFPEPVPRYIRDYYASDIQTSGSLILWALSGVVKTFARARTVPSTSQVGIEFEKRLMREICETFPNAQIESTPITGDQGADVLVTIDGIKFVIQAKRYTGVVGNAAVQEVFAAQQFYGADFALVVTTSRYTTPAQALAQKIGVELTTADDFLRRMQQLLI